MTAIDLSDRLDQLEVFEERQGVTLQGLSVHLEPDMTASRGWHVTVRGEVHARDGDTIANPIRIIGALYDSDGRVVTSIDARIEAATFFLLEPFELKDWYLPTADYSRVLVFPVAAS